MAPRIRGRERWNQYKQERWIVRRREAVRDGINAWDIARDLDGSLPLFRREMPGVYVRDEYRFGYEERLQLLAEEHPGSVFCLRTALHYHGLEVEPPAHIWMMLPRGAWKPRRLEAHVRFVHCAPEQFSASTTWMEVGDAKLSCYGLERTVIECFKYRRRIGAEVGPAALFTVLDTFRASEEALLEWAERLRVERIVRSYLAAWRRRVSFPELDPEEPVGGLDVQAARAPRGARGRPPRRADPLPAYLEVSRQNGTLPEWIRRRAAEPKQVADPFDD